MDINTPIHGSVHLGDILGILMVGFVCLILNKLWIRNHQGNSKTTNWILFIILLIYAAGYAYLTFFYRTPMTESHIRLTPFWSYMEAFDGLSIRRLSVARSIALNIAITIPLGYLLPAVYRNKVRRYVWTILTVLLLSVSTELIQLITRTGLCEFDDVFNNTLGGVIGAIGYLVADKITEKR